MQAFSLGEESNKTHTILFPLVDIKTTSFVSCLHVNMNILVNFLKSTETPKIFIIY